MTGFTVEPDRLAAAAQGLQGVGESLYSAITDVATTLTSASPWGGDDAGTVFGMAYGALLGHALEAMQSHVEKVFVSAQGVMSMAQAYGGTEQRVKQDFDAMKPA
jgi:hypothetical protein